MLHEEPSHSPESLLFPINQRAQQHVQGMPTVAANSHRNKGAAQISPQPKAESVSLFQRLAVSARPEWHHRSSHRQSGLCSPAQGTTGGSLYGAGLLHLLPCQRLLRAHEMPAQIKAKRCPEGSGAASGNSAPHECWPSGQRHMWTSPAKVSQASCGH